jgi:phospholipid-binding lipoprotein MlaA
LSLRRLVALLLAGGLGACAAVPAEQLGTTPPMHRLTPAEDEAAESLRVWDPIEGTNRTFYNFNAQFDRYVFLPAVRAYEFVTPEFVENRVTHFFSNLSEFRNATNGLLQARPDAAGRAVLRLALNSTVGLLGLFDVATPMGVSQEPLDFGLTLGRWGVGNGPYLVVPVLGPSNGRDFSGLVVDTAIANYVPPESVVTDYVFFNPLVYVLYAIDLRRNIDFRYFGSGSPFEYDYVRFLYTRKRELQIQALTGGPVMPEEPSPYSGPLDLGDTPLPSSTMPHQAPAGRFLP